MTSATQFGGFAGYRENDSDRPSSARTGPPVKRRAPPVFIHDAVAPIAGSTFLLEALRRDTDDS